MKQLWIQASNKLDKSDTFNHISSGLSRYKKVNMIPYNRNQKGKINVIQTRSYMLVLVTDTMARIHGSHMLTNIYLPLAFFIFFTTVKLECTATLQ